MNNRGVLDDAVNFLHVSGILHCVGPTIIYEFKFGIFSLLDLQ